MKKHLLFAFLFCFTLSHAQVVIKQVKDINPSGDSRPFYFAATSSKLFFIASDGGDNRLFATQGTEGTTIKLGPATGKGYTLNSVVSYKNKVYFPFDDNVNGTELWVSDGTVAGTKLFKDLYAGSTSSFPINLTVVNGKLFFQADNADGGRRLYVSDGTEAGTTVILNDYTDNFNGAPGYVILNNYILFKGPNTTHSGYALWISDGTAAGTAILVNNINPSDPAGTSVQLNGKVYFAADDNEHGLELWVSDGTAAGTHLIKNISPDDAAHGVYGNGSPQGFCAYNGKVYFSATDGEHGQELWVTDGTEANTHMVKDVQPGTAGSLPYHSLVYNNKLYFIAWGPDELWVTDGTEANTTKVAKLNSSCQFGAIWNNTMYIESPIQAILYQSDGTTAGTIPVKVDNITGSIYYQSMGNYFQVFNNELYFAASAYPVTNGVELVKLTTGALPLQLTWFKGEVQKDDDVLHWQTVTETNTAYFQLQQAANGTVFTPAATVAAAGNSSEVKQYSYTQKSALNPAGYYRLKMVDKDGSASYSNIVKLQRPQDAGKLSARYNNGSRQIIITNQTAASCTWQLYSAGGSLVAKGSSANSSITIPAAGMAGGIYILTCQSKAGTGKFTLPVF